MNYAELSHSFDKAFLQSRAEIATTPIGTVFLSRKVFQPSGTTKPHTGRVISISNYKYGKLAQTTMALLRPDRRLAEGEDHRILGHHLYDTSKEPGWSQDGWLRNMLGRMAAVEIPTEGVLKYRGNKLAARLRHDRARYAKVEAVMRTVDDTIEGRELQTALQNPDLKVTDEDYAAVDAMIDETPAITVAEWAPATSIDTVFDRGNKLRPISDELFTEILSNI